MKDFVSIIKKNFSLEKLDIFYPYNHSDFYTCIKIYYLKDGNCLNVHRILLMHNTMFFMVLGLKKSSIKII